MTKNQRINAFAALGASMLNPGPETVAWYSNLHRQNAWYTVDNINRQLIALGTNLTVEKLANWTSAYADSDTDKTVGLILAGNLPLVSFHDILCVLIMGFSAKIKVSSEDSGLTESILSKLIDIEPLFKDRIEIVDKLGEYDLIIATGSNNSARYFEYYFGKVPHIIRKNRNSIAVLSGSEKPEDLEKLGNDIFDFFGLGCRSVSKIFIPKGYKIDSLFEGLDQFKHLSHHHKYHNNYEYNKSIYLINKDKHYDNGFLLLKEDSNIASPMAVVYYEEYQLLEEVENTINNKKDEIQCVVSSRSLNIEPPLFALGQSQCPALDDYADQINTLDFLNKHQ